MMRIPDIMSKTLKRARRPQIRAANPTIISLNPALSGARGANEAACMAITAPDRQIMKRGKNRNHLYGDRRNRYGNRKGNARAMRGLSTAPIPPRIPRISTDLNWLI
jgi:hypothetical protein